MTKPKRKWKAMTAAEAMAILESDPEWVAERDRRAAELEREIEEGRRIEAPIVADLRESGYEVESVWDLVNTSTPYPDALPILIKHLQRGYPPGIQDGIARALAVPDAKFAWSTLVQEYINETRRRPKGGLAAALAAIADDDVLPELISLIKDPSHGSSRILLLYGLYKSKQPEALATIVEMKDDPALKGEIEDRLKKLAKRKKKRSPNSKLH